MKLKSTLAALLALSLAAACTPTPPGSNGGSDNNENNTNNTEGCASDAECSAPTPICKEGTCVADDVPECSSDAQCSGATPECENGTCVAGSGPECETDGQCAAPTPVCDNGTCVAAPEPCTVNTDYTGQIGGDDPNEGGVFTNDAAASTYEADAGLQAVYDFIKSKVDDGTIVEDDEATADVREDQLALEAGSELQVTGAVITSMRFSTGNGTTIQDGQRALYLFPGDFPETDINGAEYTLKVGQKINFKVTSVAAFGGETPQISGISDIEITGEDLDVFVDDASGKALSLDDVNRVVRIGGLITGYQNGEATTREDAGCGSISSNGAFCFTLSHGPEGAQETLTYRTTAPFVDVGSCVTFVGPVSSFPGEFSDSANPQLNVNVFDWEFVR